MSERDAFQRELKRLGLREAELDRDGAEREVEPVREYDVSPWPDSPCSKSRPSTSDTADRVKKLKDLILKGIDRKKPHATEKGGPALFFGSFDWHSAVHAHWALLSIARVRKDAKLEALLKKRVTQTALSKERSFLYEDRNSCFELPYGRAWLLLLLDELSRRSWAPAITSALRIETERKIADWLAEALFPEGGSKGRPVFDGAHGSLLFAFLLLALSRPVTPGIEKRLESIFKVRIDPQRKAIGAVVSTPSDFLDLPSVLGVIERVFLKSKPKSKLSKELPFEKSITASNAHIPGAAMVRLWPHAIDSHAGDSKACARFHTRMNEMFSRTEQWADSFEHVAHWVPQFMWLGMWLEAGRP